MKTLIVIAALALFGCGPSAKEIALDRVVKNTNSRLPRMLNDDISFDQVTYNKTEVVFHYRFVAFDQAAAMQKFAGYLLDLQEAIIKDLCTSQEIRDEVFRRGYNAQVRLRSNDAKPIISPYVHAARCG